MASAPLRGGHYLVAECGQHRRRDLQEILIVLDHEDSLGTAWYGLWLEPLPPRHSRLCVALGRYSAIDGSDAERTLDGHMPSGLTDKAVDHAEAEPGALADLLGREEGLKNPLPHFRSHSEAGICDGKPDIRSRRASDRGLPHSGRRSASRSRARRHPAWHRGHSEPG